MDKEKDQNNDIDSSDRQLYIGQKLDIIGQLAGGISHNFNNQLTGIMGFANLICLRSKDDNIKKFAEEILGICKNAGDMVRELLTFARYKPTSSASINVHGVIATIVNLLANSIDKRITLKSDLRAERYLVVADAVQLQSALLNLALNSKDAMPKGGEILISTESVAAEDAAAAGIDPADAPGGLIRIVVADNGCGFSDDVKARLFEPFFTTKESGHVGLGMSATYKFVKSMNGDIQVDSAVGKGTTMTVLLPIHVDAAGSEAPAKAAEAKAAAGGADTTKRRGGTILLVDDDKSIRDSISAFLRNTGYSVFTASDGQDAVEKYVNTHEGIDLVIMDMVMPRMGGKEAFVKMKEINADVKAIGITGFTTHSVEEMTGLGMKRILHKPFSFDELSSVVAEYI